VAGCPPTPENLLHGLVQLQEKVDREGLVPSEVRHAERAT
jgi:NADH:ubiquinone oxidoreductase subunit B-like Fe-S oxidoreductase